MDKSDVITIEQAVKAAKFCYIMGLIKKEEEEPMIEELRFIGLFANALTTLNVADKMEDILFSCFLKEKIHLDEVIETINDKSIEELSSYFKALKIFSEMKENKKDETKIN